MRLHLAAVENAWTAILLPQLDVNLKRKTLFWHQLGPDISGVCVSQKTRSLSCVVSLLLLQCLFILVALSPYHCCIVFLSLSCCLFILFALSLSLLHRLFFSLFRCLLVLSRCLFSVLALSFYCCCVFFIFIFVELSSYSCCNVFLS